MRTRIIVLFLGVTGLCFGVLAVASGDAPSPPPMPGIHLDPGPASAAISESQARDAAYTHWTWPSSANVTSRLVTFSDDDYRTVVAGTLTPRYQHVPAWIITVKGADFAGRGGPGDAFTEVNLVVDARSGQVLELYATN